jgi:polysaccharide deacetylase family protein (PEP-CTERM system associated)
MNILTFDIEDWFHILDNESTRHEKDWLKYDSRLQYNVDRILALLKEQNQRATFFCLGWIAQKHPKVIQDIVLAGHELGTHSHLHQLVYQQSRKDFKDDLLDSIKSIEDVSGKKVTIYRSPGFSIKENCLWAFEILAEAGITIDCSIFPASRAHGGLPTISLSEPFKLYISNDVFLKEFPMSTYRIGPLRVVFSGGGYFRIFPYRAIKWFIRKSPYTMTYFHPRDFDPCQPLIKNLNTIRRIKSYYGLNSAFTKLTRLIEEFTFHSLDEADAIINWDQTKKVHLDRL